MNNEVRISESPTGIHYTMPRRNMGPFRLVGAASALFGLVLCAAPLAPFWKLIEAVLQPAPPEDGTLWVFVFLFTFMFAIAGARLGAIGLFIVAGHSEIELRDSTLYASECCGPLRWTWQRSVAGLRRFFVSEGLESLNIFGRLSAGPFGSLGVITPEWQPVVGVPQAKPMWVAPGYPRASLLVLADDLAQRCAALNQTDNVPVLERAPDFSDYEELSEQPAGSLIAVELATDGLKLQVPPGIRSSPGWYVGGGFLCFIAFAFATMFFEDPPVPDMPLWLNIVLFAASAGGGVAFIVAQANLNHRRVVLAVHGDVLIVRHTNLFGVKERRWSRAELADIFVQHYPSSEGPDHWDLQIQPVAGRSFNCLAYQEVSELRWLATVLRRALDLTGEDADRGLVVRSPVLSVRGRA